MSQKKLTKGEFKTLSEYFNTIAAAWFSWGIIAPFFAKISPVEKVLFFLSGFTFSYIFLIIALFYVRRTR